MQTDTIAIFSLIYINAVKNILARIAILSQTGCVDFQKLWNRYRPVWTISIITTVKWAFWCTLKGWEEVKLPPQSKIFKHNPKKLKITPKLEDVKIFPKHKEKICSDPYFWWCQHFFGKNSQKVAKFRVNFK